MKPQMTHYSLNTEDILSSKEIRFVDRQETNYSNLMRLTMDFDLCVLQLQRKVFSHITRRYLPAAPTFVLAGIDYRSTNLTYSPHCDSLRKLNDYARANEVDILHSLLFGDISPKKTNTT